MLDAARRFILGPSAPAQSKAEFGPGVYAMSTYPQLNSISRHPAKLMAEAQVLFHTNPWVAAAERAIYGRYVKAGWHLEDGEGNTVDAKTQGPAKVAYDLITHPNDVQGTRRGLWSLTLRHQGLCGNAFWYLDQRDSTFGVPLSTLYINPARMTPVESAAGKLLGWVMDASDNPVTQRKNLRTAVPFELEEIRHFKLDEPDWGHYGIGIAEAAYDQIQLDELANRHARGVLSSGGRIAGLVSPKPNVTINEDQWKALVRDWRNIASDPEAAKRLLIVSGPVDFTNTAANPQQLEMASLMSLARDNIFGAWQVPLSLGMGAATARGLNGGDTQAYEEAALWQGPIDLRAGSFEEQVQSILDLFGIGLRLVVESPAFDDQAPLFENAEKAKAQPLTNNERRALLGFDPLDDDELGGAIFMASEMTRIDVEPVTPPQLLPFTGQPPTAEDAAVSDSGLGEASQPVKADLRTRAEKPIRDALAEFLAKQAESIANRVKRNHAHLASKPSDTDSWWSGRLWDKELAALLTPLYESMATNFARQAAKPLRTTKAGYVDRVLDLVRRGAGLRISGINQTTRDTVARLVAQGVEEGLSPADLADRIRDSGAFAPSRAETISRTETGTVYNQAAIETYREFAVDRVEVIDGDHDAECAAANGSTWTLDEALGNPLGHPNCVRDFIPVVSGKAAEPDPLVTFAGALKAVVEREQPTPTVNVYPTVQAAKSPDVIVHAPEPAVVNVTTPEVTVHPAVVNVTTPEQPAPVVNVEAKASMPAEVTITGLPRRMKQARRNKKGDIESMIETDLDG